MIASSLRMMIPKKRLILQTYPGESWPVSAYTPYKKSQSSAVTNRNWARGRISKIRKLDGSSVLTARIRGIGDSRPLHRSEIGPIGSPQLLRTAGLHTVESETKSLHDRNHDLFSRTIHELARIVAVIEEFFGPGPFISM